MRSPSRSASASRLSTTMPAPSPIRMPVGAAIERADRCAPAQRAELGEHAPERDVVADVHAAGDDQVAAADRELAARLIDRERASSRTRRRPCTPGRAGRAGSRSATPRGSAPGRSRVSAPTVAGARGERGADRVDASPRRDSGSSSRRASSRAAARCARAASSRAMPGVEVAAAAEDHARCDRARAPPPSRRRRARAPRPASASS